MGSTRRWEEEIKGVPVRGGKKMGRGPTSVLGRKGPRGPFIHFQFLFFFFFFCFLISFVTFANLVQIASNQLCKVSKIQNHNPEQ
jgi:hypothetical protein